MHSAKAFSSAGVRAGGPVFHLDAFGVETHGVEFSAANAGRTLDANVVIGNASALPFPDEGFDVIFFSLDTLFRFRPAVLGMVIAELGRVCSRELQFHVMPMIYTPPLDGNLVGHRLRLLEPYPGSILEEKDCWPGRRAAQAWSVAGPSIAFTSDMRSFAFSYSQYILRAHPPSTDMAVRLAQHNFAVAERFTPRSKAGRRPGSCTMCHEGYEFADGEAGQLYGGAFR